MQSFRFNVLLVVYLIATDPAIAGHSAVGTTSVREMRSVGIGAFSVLRPQRRTQKPRPRPSVTKPPVATVEPVSPQNDQIWAQIYGARVFKIYQDARDPEVIYATSPLGLYVTADKGFRWNFLFSPPLPDPHVLAQLIFAQSKDSPNVMFLGANWGDSHPTIWKSENGGRDWTDASAGVIGSVGRFISDILISPGNPSVVYLVFDGGPVYKTLNGGKSWGTIEGEKRLVVNPINPENLLRPGAESHDGGLTWSKRRQYPVNYPPGSTAPPFDQMIFHPNNPSILFGRTGGDCANCLNHYWISEDHGETWRNSSLTGSVWCFGFSKESDSLLYAGTSRGVYLSNSRGRSWQRIFDSGAWSLAITDSRTIYAVTANGIWKTPNGGTTWHRANLMLPWPINRAAHNQRIFDRLCWVDDATGIIYVGSQAGYWTSGDSGFNWKWHSIKPHTSGSVVHLLTTSDETIFLNSLEGIHTYSLLRLQSDAKGIFSGKNLFTSSWPGIISPSDPTLIYSGREISSDAGFSWRAMNLAEQFFKASYGSYSNTRTVISPVSPQVAYVISSDPDAFLATTDGGNSWRSVDNTFRTNVVPDPENSTGLYSISGNSLYYSETAGKDWRWQLDISPLGDPQNNMQFAVSPSNPNTYYVASNRGVWESSNRGKSWRLYVRGLNGDRITTLVVSKTMVLAQGRYGIYRLSDQNLSWAKNEWDKHENLVQK